MQYLDLERKLYGSNFEERMQEEQHREIGRWLVGMLLNDAKKYTKEGWSNLAESSMRSAQDFAVDYGIDLRRIIRKDGQLVAILDRISSLEPAPHS